MPQRPQMKEEKQKVSKTTNTNVSPLRQSDEKLRKFEKKNKEKQTRAQEDEEMLKYSEKDKEERERSNSEPKSEFLVSQKQTSGVTSSRNYSLRRSTSGPKQTNVVLI
jgi:hypothetical protein